ncbi:DHH family phosphoesterase [Desulfovibrio ferrophilus]|uniref:Exopolyphosphatase-like enzyme n=1 Tax=Desulfovibrio ferrophilus TaxID=241368 RepID=A0A2Z6AXF9_9BACT|nr:bifunctional oligoribonuclease/PAP phosphatase NrnA [Desulfovibrio ferrophilus]BBD07921.1 exopolyphosphatase-like enzyme [Desulfovibrio ferrophilus]
MDSPIKAISQRLRDGESFLIVAHSSPDGDAIGSSTALGHILQSMGKRVVLYNESRLPKPFCWVPLPCPLVQDVPNEKFDWIISLDCGDKHRMGSAMAENFGAKGTINIDHHLGNPEFAEINWVDTGYAAVGEMIAVLARELDMPLSDKLGECIYLAIVTDTGSFSFGNTSPRTLELAAEILRQGLDPSAFVANLQNQWTLGRMKLWSRIFAQAELHCAGQLGVIHITKEMFENTGTSSEDTDGVVNFIGRIKGVKAAILLREDSPELTKISLRSTGDINVQAIAAELGGGGHKNASGCAVHAPIDKAEQTVLEVAARLLGCPRKTDG